MTKKVMFKYKIRKLRQQELIPNIVFTERQKLIDGDKKQKAYVNKKGSQRHDYFWWIIIHGKSVKTKRGL